LCGAAINERPLCAACAADLPRLPHPRCAVCAVPLASGSVCGACLQNPPHFAAVKAAFVYRFPVDALIHAFKYGGNLAVAAVLAPALAEAIGPERADLMIPMPLAAGRLASRGFNQAQELARILERFTGIPVAAGICRKVLETAPQASLPWKERAKNVRSAFVCGEKLEGLRVAVVDDVMTSGASLNELAKCLRRAGAIEVHGWLVARALRREPVAGL
jgi:ComF family protein